MIRPDGTAPPVEPMRPGEPPLAILVDYDGTVALTDVSDKVMAEHVPAIRESEAAAFSFLLRVLAVCLVIALVSIVLEAVL